MTAATRRRRAGLVVAVAVTVALGVAGCGGGGREEKVAAVSTQPPLETTTTMATTTTSPPAADTTLPPPPTTSPPAPPAPPAPGRTVTAAQAEASVLQLNDLPGDWQAQPAEESIHLDLIWQDLTTCLGLGGLEQPSAWAVSAGFTHGLATQARTMVQYRSEGANRTIVDALANPAAADCRLQGFIADVERSKPEGAVREDASVSALDVPPAGQQMFAWRMTARLNLNGLKVPVIQDLLVAFKGEAVIPMVFLDVGNPFDPGLEGALVDKVVSRA